MENLKLEEYENNQYEFSHNLLNLLFVKYINIIGVVGLLIVFAIDVFYEGGGNSLKIRFPLISLQYALPILLFFGALHYFYYYKQAHKIIFNADSLTIFLYRHKKPIKYKLDDLKVIRINLFYVFQFEDGCSFWFNDYKSIEYLDFLKSNKLPLKWGKVGKSRFKM